MVGFFRARTVVLPPAMQAVHDEYRRGIARFDEAYMALEWRLARAPDHTGAAALHPGWRTHVQAADMDAGTPEIWVLYSFDDREVIIRDLHCPQAH